MTLWPNPSAVSPWLGGGEIIAHPPRGAFVHARHPDHHLAGYVFYRDDREGHDDGRVFWSFRHENWMTWRQIVRFSARFHPLLRLEPLYRTEHDPGCQPDGAHGPDHCPDA